MECGCPIVEYRGDTAKHQAIQAVSRIAKNGTSGCRSQVVLVLNVTAFV